MLYLSANSTNVIYTSVSVHKTLSNPTYLMTLTHQQTGKKWSFIPQNITKISDSAYSERYDIFKFDISDTNIDLTGGTRIWYWQTPPNIVYQDARYSGTNQNYIRDQRVVPNSFRVFQVTRSFSDPTEVITGGTFNVDGTNLTAQILTDTSFGNNGTARVALSAPVYDSVVIEYEFTTNLGNTYSDTVYTSDINEVYNQEIWKKYDPNAVVPDAFKSYPITYLTTPVVNIDEIGEFRYSIREQLNPINLNPQYTTDLLESGLGFVYQTFDDIYYDRGGDDIVYNPS